MRSSSIALAVSLFSLLPSYGLSRMLPSYGNPQSPVTIIFAGDLLLDRGVRREIARHGTSAAVPDAYPSGIDSLFTPSIDSLFRQSQVVVANLECPATKLKAPVFKRFIFRAEPEWLPALRHHGITHLNLANNHSIDQGRDGLMDTRLNIISAGMTPIGADSTMAAASQPVLLATVGTAQSAEGLPRPPRNVWMLASVRLTLENFPYLENRPCVSQEPMDSLLSRIARLRAADPLAAIIVSLHWGAEHTLKPVPAQRMDARCIIDAGADALVCHHTHTMQTVETYRGKPVYYSIGNFIFDQPKPINSRACLVRLTVTADSVAAETVPIVISHCAPHIQDTAP